ncbi:MAG TPA: CNNM domain-containing protein [Verrucomicrobiae bacterium]|jgi:putative hemolysin|nr:CNNM domain-containing protein [Verrucomicrobiae bacterium]
MNQILITTLVILACMGLSFLFSGMEAGVLALSRLRVRQLMRTGNRRAVILHGYLEKPEDFLWTILVGNTLANLAAVGLLAVLLHQWLGNWPVLLTVSFLAVMFLFYALCELLPKMLFRMFPNRLCLGVAGPFRFIHLVLSPLVLFMTRLSRGLLHWTGGKTFTGNLFGSREEMRLFMQESAQGLTSEERMLINRVLDLQNITVRNVMIPMEQVATVTMQTPMGDALKVSQERNVYQLPVWRGESGAMRIAGLMSLRAVLYQAELDPSRTAGDYVKPAFFLDEETRLEEALKRMQRGGQRLAIVLGRDQREVGIVSLQDILKVIFGEVKL